MRLCWAAMSQGGDSDDIGLASTRASMEAIAPASDASAPELKPGMVLNETYELVAKLGAGGMGEVWKAQHVRLPKPVAIKVLLPSVSASGEVVARFQREAEIGSRLAHPHIVHVTDFNTLPDGRKYIAMEFLQGKALHDRMIQGPMAYPEVAEILKQTAKGLSVAHDAGVVHRDLKPDNLFLADEPGSNPPYRVKILDFGISKIQKADRALTRDMAVMGTPGYMAPEQAMGHTAQLGPEADQFALGTIAYEMLTGNVAFDGETLAEIVLRVVQEMPPPIETVVPGVPAHCAAAIARAMSKDPQARFPSVAAFVEAATSSSARAIPATELGAVAPVAPAPAAAAAAAAAAEPASRTAETLAGPDEVARPTGGGNGKAIAIGLVVLLAIGGGVAAFALGGRDDSGPDLAQAPTVGGDAQGDGDGPATGEAAATGNAATGNATTGTTATGTTSGTPATEGTEAGAIAGSDSETTGDGPSAGEGEDPGPPEVTETGTSMAPTPVATMAPSESSSMDPARMAPTMRGGDSLSPEASALLDEADQKLAGGDPRGALMLARRSNRVESSARARETMARAYCQMRDLSNANAMARGLPRGAYRRLARYCQQAGLPIAPR